MDNKIIGKKCLSAQLISGLYPSLNFGEFTLEVGPVFWMLLLEGSIETHCYQIPDISEFHLEELVNSELLDIVTDKSETEIKIGSYVLRLNSFKNNNYEHFKISNHLEKTDERIVREFINNTSKFTCSRISNTFGTTVLIDFGIKNEIDEYPLTIMIESTNWTLFDAKMQKMTSSQNTSNSTLQKILGAKLNNIEIKVSDYTSNIIFDNGLRLSTEISGLDTPHWTLSKSGKNLTYGPKDILEYTK